MADGELLSHVIKAIKSGLGGCVDWDFEVVERTRQEMLPFGLTPQSIKAALIEFVQTGGAVRQVKEQRHGWKDRRDYYYKAIVPIPHLFSKGLFVEIELINTDPEYPEVLLVNAHEQH